MKRRLRVQKNDRNKTIYYKIQLSKLISLTLIKLMLLPLENYPTFSQSIYLSFMGERLLINLIVGWFWTVFLMGETCLMGVLDRIGDLAILC